MKKGAKFLIWSISTFIIFGICVLPALSISAEASSTEINILETAVVHMQEDLVDIQSSVGTLEDTVKELQEQLDKHIKNDTAILKIEKTATEGNVDTYTITLTDETTTTFTVTNGTDGKDGTNGTNGTNGKNGADGTDGEDGADGITPQLRINDENIWEVSYDNGATWESLGISAVGQNGTNGRDGADGKDGTDGVDGADGKDGGSSILPLIISCISLAGMIAMFCIMMADRKKGASAPK